MDNKEYLKCMQNRELSWLKFNERVLEEAGCTATPLLERMKFLSIFTSNLDEFFMVRVGTLTDCMMMDPNETDNKTDWTAEQQLDRIYRAVPPLYRMRDEVYAQVAGELKEHGVTRVGPQDLTERELAFAESYFENTVLPVLSPQIIDTWHPFPHMVNKQLHIAVLARHDSHRAVGIIPVPSFVDRVIWLDKTHTRYLLAEDLVYRYAERAFPMYQIKEKTVICVTRNADIDTDTGLFDEDVDYRQHMKKLLKRRSRLAPVRLELQYHVSSKMIDYFCDKLGLHRAQVFTSNAPLDLSCVFAIIKGLEEGVKKPLLYQPFTPHVPDYCIPDQSMMRLVEQQDILLSYPFESMKPFLDLMREAASNREVLSIKITLYRIARQSKLAEALIAAAENGKEVTVLMELRARFDEQNNIEWASRLEEAGCHVIYGADHYKVHSKICLITLKTNGAIRYLTQIGTGNYNEKTAAQYTDLCLMTASQEIGEDADAFFKNMMIANLQGEYRHLWVAPSSFKQNILKGIEGEIEKAQRGQPARILMKCNSLTDKELMERLVDASVAGVRIELIIRGICCLVPAIDGLTQNIRIISIVGRFLEHSRLYCFGQHLEKIALSSGDMMTRNTERRVEIACPVYDPALKSRLVNMLETLLHDNVKARELSADGLYSLCIKPGAQLVHAQQIFMEEAKLPTGIVRRESAAQPPLWRRLLHKKPKENEKKAKTQ